MVKCPRLGFELGEEDRLKQEIAKLFAEAGMVVAVDGLENLVGLLEDEGLQGIDGLLPVPRAATRRPKARDDIDETAEFCGGAGGTHRHWSSGRLVSMASRNLII